MYNKIFTKILDSSIWLESDSTRIVWVTLLAAMDEDGFCAFACATNVANRAIVPIEKAEEALKTLEGPDPNSADPEHEGRRIERVPGGWIVLNAPKYREVATREKIRESNRRRAQAFRNRRRNDGVTPSNVSSCNQSKSESELEPLHHKATAPPSASPQKNSRSRGTRIPEDFSVRDEHRAFAHKLALPNPDHEVDRFKDYWRAIPGQRGLKLDWDATFRNWLRKAADMPQNGSNGTAAVRQKSALQQDRELLALGAAAR